MALVGAFLATFRDYRPFLSPGERATIPLIAADRRQARTLARYLRALLTEVPMLKRMVEGDRAEGFDLTNRITIEVHTASFRAVRGYTLAAALCDEVAFWPQEDSADPRRGDPRRAPPRPRLDPRQHAALRLQPARQARRAVAGLSALVHGQDDAPVLVWQADTRTMNPSISERVIAEAYERDPARAAAEYGAQFRNDVESFVSRELVEACGRARLPGTGAAVGVQLLRPSSTRQRRRQRQHDAGDRASARGTALVLDCLRRAPGAVLARETWSRSLRRR